MNQMEKGSDTRSEKQVKKFKLYKLISITVLVLFLLCGLILFKNDITIENLRYMIKYLDFSTSGAFDEEFQVHYNANPDNRFYVFRGDLAIVNESGVTLYDRRGSAVMTDSFSMTSPVGVCAERYLAIYDLGGYQVRIYNSFSLLFEKSFDYMVQSVSVNKDGSFCVVTSEKSYHSAVFVYDRDFRQVQQWFSADKFAVDAHLSDDNVLTVSTIRAQDGDLYGELIAFKIGKKDPLYTYPYRENMPLALTSKRNRAALMTDERMYLIKEGEEKAKVIFPKESLAQIRMGEELLCVVQNELSIGVNFRLRVFDWDGTELASEKFSVQILDVQIWEDTVYVLTHTGLFVISPGEKTKVYELEGDFFHLGILSKDTVVLCSETSAQIRLLNEKGEIK